MDDTRDTAYGCLVWEGVDLALGEAFFICSGFLMSVVMEEVNRRNRSSTEKREVMMCKR